MENLIDIPNLLNSKYAPIVVGILLTGLLRLLKQTPHVPDWSIPHCAVGLGVVIMVGVGHGGLTKENVVSGLFSGMVAVWGNQFWRQTSQRLKDGPETEETRQFRRRWEEMTDKKVSAASQGGPQSVVVTTPSQPSKVEVIAKEKLEPPAI